MLKNRLVYYPLFVLLLVFAVDKVALIPSVADLGKARKDEMEKYNQYAYTLVELADPAKPTVGVIGTSRSAIVRFLTEREIDRSKLSVEDKAEMKRSQFLNLTVFGSDMFWQYATLYYLLEQEKLGDRFDYFFVELSPLMMNKVRPLNLARDYITVMNMEPGFILNTLPMSSGSLRGELITRLAFASYSRHFSPFRAAENYIKRVSGKEKDPVQARMEQYYFRMVTLGNEDVPDDLVDYPEREGIPEDVYQQRFRGFAEKGIPSFETDPNQLNAFYAILDLLKKHGIPVLVWMPMPHPEIIARYTNVFEPQLPEIRNRISERGALFYDLRARYPEFECKRFTDANHMSPRCSTFVVDRLLDYVRASDQPIRLRYPDRQKMVPHR